MSIIVDILILAGALLAIVAVVQVAAARLVLPESTLLSAIASPSAPATSPSTPPTPTSRTISCIR